MQSSLMFSHFLNITCPTVSATYIDFSRDLRSRELVTNYNCCQCSQWSYQSLARRASSPHVTQLPCQGWSSASPELRTYKNQTGIFLLLTYTSPEMHLAMKFLELTYLSLLSHIFHGSKILKTKEKTQTLLSLSPL